MPAPSVLSLDQGIQLPSRPLHLAIGMFDGVHLGHRAVIEAAVHSARWSGGISSVLTFHPHPSAVLGSARQTRLIMGPPVKAKLMLGLGADSVIVEPFTPEFARIAAPDFLPMLKARLPHLAGLYVGENWRFGAGRQGDVPLLVKEAKAAGITVFSAPRVNLDGEPVSSTRIRPLLESGEIEAASALLGYNYFAEGPIVSGRRLGRTIGFPTLNLAWAPDLLPRLGVYAARVSGIKSPRGLPAVMNYGVRPTVGGATAPVLEAHMLVPFPFAQGDVISVEWLHFFRPEMKFGGLDELQSQIARDVGSALQYFATSGGL